MQVITSKDNELIKNIKKLKEKKYRDLENKFIVEGIKMVQEAINENAKICKIISFSTFISYLCLILFYNLNKDNYAK